MTYPIIEAALYLTSATLTGVTIATIYWRNRMADSSATIGRLIYENEKLTKAVKHWRTEANIIAIEAQKLRAKVPQRDPSTNRFVKRDLASSVRF